MQLTIENVKPTAKSLVLTAGGKEYFAKKASGLAVGMTIDAEVEVSEYNGKTYTWIQKYKAINGSAAPQVVPVAAATEAPGGFGRTGSVAPAGAAPVWSNFVSNQVAHAIQAGLITDPSQIKLWAAAAKQAFTEL